MECASSRTHWFLAMAGKRVNYLIDISINRDTGVRRAIYVMNSGIFNNCATHLRHSIAQRVCFFTPPCAAQSKPLALPPFAAYRELQSSNNTQNGMRLSDLLVLSVCLPVHGLAPARDALGARATSPHASHVSTHLPFTEHP
jgi:hypothetical protein